MKKCRFIAFILCIAIVVTNLPVQTSAFERKEHDKYMSEVMFKNFKEIENDSEVQDEIAVLSSACYLTIDQFNGNGQKDLDVLWDYKVKNIPKDVKEITFNASGKTHRTYTHQGWGSKFYSKLEQETCSWTIRQNIMMNTVDKVFDFDGDVKKQESFCKVLYYIHILGDHKDDTSWKINNGLKMGVGGRNDNIDIIHELLDAFKVLFKGQKYTFKYRSLTNGLQRIDNRLSKIVNSEGGVNTDEEFELYQEYVDDTLKILTYYLPEMLKDESFFHEVFYD